MNRFGLGKIVDVRLAREAAQIGLLARIGFDCFLEGLVGGDPQILAQRIVIAIDAHGTGRADEAAEAVVADEIGAVQFVISDARFHIHEAIARVVGS